MRELALGVRLGLAGGRSTRIRTALTALGVGLGMIVLLTAASVPTVLRAVDARQSARDVVGGPRPRLLVATSDTTFRGDAIRGRSVQVLGPRPPLPPGVSRMPGPGELVVSPALRDLLAAEPLLRERLSGRIVGTIGAAGLSGAREYAFYAGAARLSRAYAQPVSRFGLASPGNPLPGFLVLLIAVAVVILLLPIGVFIATAVRFGSDARDRRLAALRLVGADRAMAVRIAAGEAVSGALAGMAIGAVGFLALRPLAENLRLQDISVFASDLRPSAALTALIVVAVPAAAVIASVVALRRVVVEPLGVTRRGAGARRRLLWRLVPLVLGGVIIGTHRGDLLSGNPPVAAVSIGVSLMLTGITALLPWAVDAVVRRLTRGGVSWQLAVRRLQMDGGTAARAVAGVAVAVAGAIALQTVLAQGERDTRLFSAPQRMDVHVGLPGGDVNLQQTLTALRATRGVRSATAVAMTNTARPMIIGACADLRQYAQIGTCRNGDTFRTGPPSRRFPDARRVLIVPGPDGYPRPGVLVTPAVAGGLRIDNIDAFADLDGMPDAIEYVRNTAFRLAPGSWAGSGDAKASAKAYRTVRRAIFAGAYVVLAIIALSLLVGALEQLRERRPVLAALSAFGVPRGTLMRSVLWQAAVPVVLGLIVSVSVGVVLAVLLLRVAGQTFTADWPSIAAMAGAGAATIVLVTVASLPAVTRLMRPEGLRTE